MRSRRPALKVILRWSALAVGCAVWPHGTSAVSSILVNGGQQSRLFTSADLVSGAGSNFITSAEISTTFTISVTSDGPCEVRVQRSSDHWLPVGNLVVHLKTGSTYGSPILVDSTHDQLLLSSTTALTNQSYELRYSLQGVTVENPPGHYEAVITYTVTDTPTP